MKTRAAVAWKAGAPLDIETIDIEGPKAGEVLVEIKATGICHTDAYTLSGSDPEGRRSRHPALHTRMPAMQNVRVAQVKSLHRHPRNAGEGRDAGRHQPLS